MSKGKSGSGSTSVDTSGLTSQAGLANQYASMLMGLGSQVYPGILEKQQNLADTQTAWGSALADLGTRYVGSAGDIENQYTRSLLDQMMGVLGLGTKYDSTTGWSYPSSTTTVGGDTYSASTSPFASTLFGGTRFTTAEQLGAAKKKLMETDPSLVGPVQKAMLSSQLDVQGLQGLQTGALDTVKSMLTSALSSAGTMASSRYSAGLGLLGSGLSAYSGAASGLGQVGSEGLGLYGQDLTALSSANQMLQSIAQLQTYAAMSNAQSQSQGLSGILNLAGVLYGKSGGISGISKSLGGLSSLFSSDDSSGTGMFSGAEATAGFSGF